MRIRAIAGAVWLCATAVLTSCSSSTDTFTDSPLNGTWDVIAIDGDGLPVVFPVTIDEISCTITISAVHFELRGNGRYGGGDTVTRQCNTTPPSGPVNLGRTYSGTWRTVGNVLYMKEDHGVELPSQYVLAGNTLTITSAADGDVTVTVLQRR